jgi:hypothetical protein
MNALEVKANELADMARAYGLEPEIEVRGDWLVFVRYSGRFYSQVSYTNTEKVSVKSWDSDGVSRESVALKHLDEVLKYVGERKKNADERRARKEAEKFLSDHIQIITVS